MFEWKLLCARMSPVSVCGCCANVLTQMASQTSVSTRDANGAINFWKAFIPLKMLIRERGFAVWCAASLGLAGQLFPVPGSLTQEFQSPEGQAVWTFGAASISC